MQQTFKTKITKSFYLLVALAGLTLASSCSKTDPNDEGGAGSAKVQLINTSTDAGASKLYIDNELRIATAVSFGGASGYSGSFAGTQDVTVQSASGVTLAKVNTQLDASAYYSFFLTGTTGNYALLAVQDDNIAASSGKAKVRFVQASTGLTSANLIAGGTALFSAQAFKAVTAYSEVTAGAYVFTVTNTGSANVLATSATTTLQAGKNYTIYTSGISGTSGTTALAIGVAINN